MQVVVLNVVILINLQQRHVLLYMLPLCTTKENLHKLHLISKILIHFPPQ